MLNLFETLFSLKEKGKFMNVVKAIKNAIGKLIDLNRLVVFKRSEIKGSKWIVFKRFFFKIIACNARKFYCSDVIHYKYTDAVVCLLRGFTMLSEFFFTKKYFGLFISLNLEI